MSADDQYAGSGQAHSPTTMTSRCVLTVPYESCESVKSTTSSSRAINNGSTATSTVGGQYNNNHRHKQRVSILKRLREKLSVDGSLVSSYSDPTTIAADGSQPTVIRVGGTVSSCASTVRSWRVVDDFLRNRFDFSSPSRQSTVSNRSIGSGKTYIYDDKALEINQPDFCTIVKIDDCQMAASASVEALPSSDLPLEYVNVIVESNSQRSVHHSSPSNLRVVEPLEHARQSSDPNQNVSTEGDAIHVCSPSPQNVHSSNVTATAANNQSLANSATTSNLFPQPPQPRICASGNPPIELTNWRIRPDFEDVVGNRPAPGGDGQQSPDGNGFTNINVLTPEDLPRMFAGWNVPMPPPFRFDEEFEEEPKGCCGSGRFSHSMMIRIFIAVISLIGLSCVIVGIVLGALTVSGSTRLTLCLLMIGVGVVLIIVSGIAWRLTSLDPSVTPSCWTVLGLRAQRPQSVFPERRSRTAYYRVRNVRRPLTPFCGAGMLQSEFAWRPPPPTYQATMQEMRLQNFLCARNRGAATSGSPPPTYRSETAGGVDTRPSLNEFIERISRPPSYRSHESIRAVSIEERPLLNAELLQQQARESSTNTTDRQRQRDNDGGHQMEICIDGTVVATSEQIHSDDRANLVAHDELQHTSSVDNVPSTSSKSASATLERNPCNRAETISVIDCSSVDPVVTLEQGSGARPSPHCCPRRGINNGRHPHSTDNTPFRTPIPNGPSFFCPPPPPPTMGQRQMMRIRDDFGLRYPMPFMPMMGNSPRHMHPLVPVRVGPPPPMRWRTPIPPNAQLQNQHRLATVMGNMGREDLGHNNSFGLEQHRDPSYV